ncbi:ATP-binding protein [Neobacillus citreus]|uniref:histidine kinase n=1 Tax=Neobacillus citreus TaxID=2833578 RepID=A0A942Y621_9BACI|nr:ATP-binding protein [Neobacillus citreus]MCH6266839.1 histidine kinase [Neobacillus citreus]
MNGVNKKLFLFQVFVIIFSILTLVFFIQSIAGYYDTLRNECILKSCSSLAPAPPTTIEALSKYHLTSNTYAALFVIIESAFAFLFFTAAIIIFIKSRRDMMGLLAVLALVTYGATYTSLVYLASDGREVVDQFPEIIGAVGRMALFLFFLIFPNGRFIHRWQLVLFTPFCIIQFISLIFPGTVVDLLNWSSTARLVYYGIMIIVTIYSQIYQYKKISTQVERQQTKWVVFGLSLSFLGSIIVSGFFVYPIFGENPVSYLYLSALLYGVVAIIPLTLAFAILRHRLWDIDPLVNRTVVYGILSLAIILLYSFLVLYFSSLFKTDNNFIISLVATAIVAILFAPIKERLQRLVNRLMKGRHDEPYTILKELGDHLIRPIAPEEMLNVVTGTIRDALRLPYAGIFININGKETLAAASGKVKFDIHTLPIIHGGEELGTLHLSSRSLNEVFTGEDNKLIEVILRQAGPVLQNVKMTLGMKLLANDLQQSRERLVLAREEERLHIRRNLHDDLAPRLMSLAFNVAAAEQYIERNPAKALELMEGLRQVIRSTVDEIRTMVHGLRPPTLDEFGLLGSIQARVDEIRKTSEEVSVTSEVSSIEIYLEAPESLPVLPAAVEVAAYRIITEALVNVIRHSNATKCTVRLTIVENTLELEVTDNGVGFPDKLRPSQNGGIGLTSIRERALELGGKCEMESLETGGARVRAVLPFSTGVKRDENSFS